MTSISISSLYNSVTAYADQLEQKGFTVVTFKFKAGNQAGIGPSYVDFEITKGDFYMFVKILANGYGATHDNHISTADGWKAAKAQIQARIDKEVRFIAHTTTDNTVTINGQVYIASEVATTQDDEAACVESRWNLFNIDGTRDERTETGQCGFLARWFDGRFGFWLVGTPHRVVLQKGEAMFGLRVKSQTPPFQDNGRLILGPTEFIDNITDGEFGTLDMDAQREGLLNGRWIDADVVVVTDHPEAETIDAAFDASNLQKFFFTCGQAHSHDVDGSTWNKDSVLQVMAVDENAARELVFARFGPKWSHQYDEATMNFEYFPDGICATIYA